MAGGGAHGKVAGIARAPITGAGATITMFQAFIMTWTLVGETITGTGTGPVIGGTMNGFLISDCRGTGNNGMPINTGKETEPGV